MQLAGNPNPSPLAGSLSPPPLAGRLNCPLVPLAGSLVHWLEALLFLLLGGEVAQCQQRCVVLIVCKTVRFPQPLDLLLRHQHGRSFRLCFHIFHVVFPACWPRIKLCLARYSTPLHEAQDGVQLFLRVDWDTIPDLPNPLPAAAITAGIGGGVDRADHLETFPSVTPDYCAAKASPPPVPCILLLRSSPASSSLLLLLWQTLAYRRR